MKKILAFLSILFIVFLFASCRNNDSEIDNSNQTETKDYCIVTFDLKDESGKVINQKVQKGETVKKPTDPSIDGYTFCGWLLNNEYWNFENSIAENTVLVAHWIKDDEYSFIGDEMECILEKYSGKDSVVIIPPYYKGMEVRGINASAFKDNESIYTVVLPETIVSIGSRAFEKCLNLRTVNLPSSLRVLNGSAFKDCKYLNQIKYDCIELIDFKQHNMVFYDCGVNGRGITVTIGNQVKKLPNYLFDSKCKPSDEDYNEYKGDVRIPKITNVIFEEGSVCERIGEYAFYESENLKSVNLPDSIKVIDDLAFGRCISIVEIKLPYSLEKLGFGVFVGNENLTKVEFPTQTTSRKIVFENWTFRECKKLVNIDFKENFVTLGEETFYDCELLENVDLGQNVTVIPKSTFENCEKLTNVNISDSVTLIGDYAFRNCSSLKLDKLPSKITSIGSSSFHDCDTIEEVIIPKTVTRIGSDAFASCSGIKKVIVENNVEKLLSVFSGCSALEIAVINDNVKSMESTFYGCSSLKTIKLPKNLEYLGRNTFYGCTSLQSVEFNSLLTKIDYGCFKNCKSLKEIILPYGVSEIQSFAFSECDSLIKIWIPKTVTKLARETFENSKSVKIYAQSSEKPDGWESGFDYNTKGVLWLQEG